MNAYQKRPVDVEGILTQIGTDLYCIENPRGIILGPAVVSASWRVGGIKATLDEQDWCLQVEALIGGQFYTGRCMGIASVWRGRHKLVEATCGCRLDYREARKRYNPQDSWWFWVSCPTHGNVNVVGEVGRRWTKQLGTEAVHDGTL